MIEARGANITKYRPSRHSWNGGSIGRSDVWLNYAMNRTDKWVAVEISLGGERAKAKAHFDWLWQRKAEVEASLGELEWQRLDHRKASRIRKKLSADVTDRTDWARQHGFIIDNRVAFERVFRPMVADDAFPE